METYVGTNATEETDGGMTNSYDLGKYPCPYACAYAGTPHAYAYNTCTYTYIYIYTYTYTP